MKHLFGGIITNNVVSLVNITFIVDFKGSNTFVCVVSAVLKDL